MRVLGRLRGWFVVLLASTLLAVGCGSRTRDAEGAGGRTAQGFPVTVTNCVPHVVRLLVGADHRRALPAAALLGASFLVACDIAARTIAAPEEVPVGVLTALIGGPFFLWLMRRKAMRVHT